MDPEETTGNSVWWILRPWVPRQIWIDVPKWPVGLVHSSLCADIPLNRFSWRDLIHSGHARFQVFVDVAVRTICHSPPGRLSCGY